jgi:hypothetical protein
MNFFLVEPLDNGILEELKAEPVDEKIRRYKSYWLRHVTRMNINWVPKIMLNYRTNEEDGLVRPLKILTDEAGTGLP